MPALPMAAANPEGRAGSEGVALGTITLDHVLCSLGRVAVKRALILCHVSTIEGREYRQCLPAPAA